MINKIGTIQVDLDGLWTNLEYYGHKSDISPDVVFESSVPRFLDLFEKYDVKATFFLIGKDGEVKRKADLVKQIAKAGHEIANHTYSHVFGFRGLPVEEKLKEIKKGEEIIRKITGKKLAGFKTPGYDLDGETLSLLVKQGYLYDSSVIPTPVYPLVMGLNWIIGGGIKRTHGPRWSWFFAPNKIYQPSAEKEWKKGDLKIKELPCTVMPYLRLPYHTTFAIKLGLNYFRIAHKLIKAKRMPFNYEFHAVDLSDEIKDKRLPHLRTSLKKRLSVCESILKILTKNYRMVTSEELVKIFEENGEQP